MNKRPLRSIGYNFINPAYLPAGKDEYHLRNFQNRNGIAYRHLSAYEIEVLVRNRNTSDDWNKIQVSDAFNPELVKNCKFYGLVRIGKLESVALEYHNIAMPVGLYDSTIISCDFGDNVVINNVNYLSHYIVGNEVMIVNVNELHATDHSKFGNGIIKEGEAEEVRIWLEVRNENGGRKILPFNGMQPGDAWLWSKYRDDAALMEKFKEFTERKFDKQRGYYGKIGDNCVIKNTAIIKDVWVGPNAYIKGANKLKNLTINSSPEAPSQIGEGCELVNGIIGFGCRLFYGVKAVRFFMASHSQLKYGARLINSYLGNNSTISCCEVLNSLIYPSHEQHHNNSFLCAALVMGQSNIAAGATIGSNHNSRAADGELVAARGFWPGLCVSLKHNSRFATFTLLAKGDYPAELDIRLPFSLVSNDTAADRLVVMPCYWFLYNMYALARNAAKYVDRDKRTKKTQHIEYDYLAPDSVNEIMEAIVLLEGAAGRAAGSTDEATSRSLGREALESDGWKTLTITAEGFEGASRPVVILKAGEAYRFYKELIRYHAAKELLVQLTADRHAVGLPTFTHNPTREDWQNLGGQLVPKPAVEALLQRIKTGAVTTWNEVHQFYQQQGRDYAAQKRQHALAAWMEMDGLAPTDLTARRLSALLDGAVATRTWMNEQIRASRAKDYDSEFRKMVYDTEAEMEQVLGRLEDNVFIKQQEEALAAFRRDVAAAKEKWAAVAV